MSFPSTLDISPFISDSILKSRISGSPLQTISTPTASEIIENNSVLTSFESSQYIYKLFSVVNHVGSIDTGHYTSYIIHPASSLWYHFDDQTISKATLPVVLNSQGYLLFYIRATELLTDENNNLEDSN